MTPRGEAVLTISCLDRPGIVFAVSGFLVGHSANITQNQQYEQRRDGVFYMRITFELLDPAIDLDDLRRDFAAVAVEFGMTWRIVDPATPTRTLIMVSRPGHCLNDVCKRLAGRVINIHHSFLPSFVGAKPYEQAHRRGVKLVGATAHYVTPDLDEGPIIEQDVVRVDHTMDATALAAAGRDVEARVLARAVTWHTEHRVLLDRDRTVVFH
jgi:formyltetrahydrofolate hydrolase